jgi:hypothetical protein
MALKYLGTDKSTDWLPGIPARDLTDDEEKEYPDAAASVLYVKVTKGKA